MTDWDGFESRQNTRASDRRLPDQEGPDRKGYAQTSSIHADGLLDPLAFISFIFGNIGKILLLTAVLTGLGLGVFNLLKFPYLAKAIVLVDPRVQGVQVSEQVVTSINGNAAILESIVQLISSDDFLRPVVRDVKAAEDPEFQPVLEKSKADSGSLLLKLFKKNLDVNRIGATFVVEVGFRSKSPENAAKYANAVARAFIAQQRTERNDQTAITATSLSERLVGLRKTLQRSERSVADYRAANNIINVGAASTLLQRELTEISAQVAQAMTTTEVARARYQQISNRNNDIFNISGDQGDGVQLRTLRQQQGAINQNLAELGLTYGARHPRIAAERSKLTNLATQVERERSRLITLSKQRLDAALATQKALQTSMEALSAKANDAEGIYVVLSELEREAAANRTIYEDFLSRFKSADKQQDLQGQEAKLASAATPPLSSTRPRTILAGGLIGILSFALSVVLIFVRDVSTKGKLRLAEGVSEANINQAADHPANNAARPEQKRIRQRQLNHQLSPPGNDQSIYTNAFHSRQARGRSQDESLQSAQTARAGARYRDKFHESRSGFTSAVDYKPPTTPTPITASCLGLPTVPDHDVLASIDMEKYLASHMTQIPELAGLIRRRGRPAATVLVGSWYPGEGKTIFARSLAYAAYEHGAHPIIVKTPQNGLIEDRHGTALSPDERPYSVFDPQTDHLGGQPIAHTSFAALNAVIEQSQTTFDLVIIDAATIPEELYFGELSTVSTSTFLILNQPAEQQVEAIAERTVRAHLNQVSVVLNNVE